MKRISEVINLRKYLPLYLTIIVLVSIPLTVWGVNKIRELRSKAAGSAILYLTPATQNINQNNSFTVQVRENSGSEPVNAVQANLSYDPTKLDYLSTDFTGSAFEVAAESVGGNGTIRIARGVTGGQPAVTGDKLIATITFKARTIPGTTTVNFAAGSIIARSTDNTDILGTTNPGTYTIINPPPSVSVTNPSNNALILGTVNVTANASDDLAVTNVEFLVDGVVKGSDATSPYSYSLNTLTLSNSTHTISAKAYDSTTSTTASITVTIDNAPPTVSITSPTTGTTVSGIVNIAATATDNHSINKVEFYVDNTLLATDATSPYSYSWDSTTIIDGTHSLKAKAFDSAGNNTTATISITVSNKKLGDINGDNKVDLLDLSTLLTLWNTNDPSADLNKDGIVNVLDLSTLLSKWGT